MQYVSTRGHSGRKQFCEALLEGLAPDGGLYVPETYPRVDHATLDAWRTLSYANLAFEILSLYVGDIPSADLKAICAKTYTPEVSIMNCSQGDICRVVIGTGRRGLRNP